MEQEVIKLGGQGFQTYRIRHGKMTSTGFVFTDALKVQVICKRPWSTPVARTGR